MAAPANSAVFLAFPSGIPYARRLPHLIPRRDVMNKKNGNGKRAVKDLEPRADGAVKGGFGMLQSAFSNVVKSIGEGLSTMARKG